MAKFASITEVSGTSSVYNIVLKKITYIYFNMRGYFKNVLNGNILIHSKGEYQRKKIKFL